MDLSVAASFFDTQPVYDAYTQTQLLFYGQPDLYDSAIRDSVTGYRRTISSASAVLPSRGCIYFGGEVYIVGRVIQDYFDGEVLRQHLLLHPSDGIRELASASVFLAEGTTAQVYSAVSWVKDRKEEEATSFSYPIYEIYLAASETVQAGDIITDSFMGYLRIEAVSLRTGGLQVCLGYSLGSNAKRNLLYTQRTGTYSSSTNSFSTVAPVSVPAFVETFLSNYLLENGAAVKFSPADKVATVLQADIVDPQANELFQDAGKDYRLVDRQESGVSWLLHLRPM